jgi:uncharacterized membrane protein YoaK (UPF0700 family)
VTSATPCLVARLSGSEIQDPLSARQRRSRVSLPLNPGYEGSGRAGDERSTPLVQWTAFPIAIEPPRAVPILLAAVAGFVDACTFLGLFGFFVAQVTGSYVLAGAHPVAGSHGAAVLLAVPVFFVGGVAATLAAIAGHAVARRALAAALGLETLLLIGFAATFAAGSPFAGPETAPVVAASMFGLAAMGVQSAAVRLLMRGVASTNVMTTNTSQIAIDATQLAWALLCRDAAAAGIAHQREVGRRLRGALPLPLAFLAGTLVGAVAFARAGYLVLVAPVVVVGGLTLWAALCSGARG